MAVTKPANDVLTARLAGLSLPAGGAWATEARKTALELIDALTVYASPCSSRRMRDRRFVKPGPMPSTWSITTSAA